MAYVTMRKMGRKKIKVSLPEELIREVDYMVIDGILPSRATAVERALRQYLERVKGR